MSILLRDGVGGIEKKKDVTANGTQFSRNWEEEAGSEKDAQKM